MTSYDDWKARPPEYDTLPAPFDEPACDCGQPLEGSTTPGLCTDCVRELHLGEVVKTCTCGRLITREEWTDLPLVGPFVIEPYERQEREEWESRNCTNCKSTLMLRIT